MAKRVLVYGGRGALGVTCVNAFKKAGWWVLSLDMVANDAADANVVVTPTDSLKEQAAKVTADVGAVLAGAKLNALLCVAGGFAMGDASSDDFISSCDTLIKQAVWTSAIAARLAALHLDEGGLLQLTGAKAAKGATGAMIGYGMTKAAVHQMTASLATKGAKLPARSSVLAILPVTLDTPINRQAMPQADFGTWTPLTYVADRLLTWSTDAATRPESGSLVELITAGGQTELHESKYGTL